MYLAISVARMLVLPAAGILVEVLIRQAAFTPELVGKRLVFGAVGVRLGMAGRRQILQLRYTAEVILSLKSEDSPVLVRELGFANLLIGMISLIGLIGLVLPSWNPAAVLTGGVLYALAGIHHTFRGDRN
ncbi:hypothetical protein VB738_00630 [Cyanobium gracile UHCC 0139]|uniref:Uncharacterized protein n=1 Tax=Cyanobium gracile UHCC 0139 TaxID=3110308 RepID=A0ABU5RNU0_9CYAN|nr:hypothetical protein [Cyanobium gracile]MEA5389752.1 hypothetical protein [Cyanobium gracile UHCC 0139]